MKMMVIGDNLRLVKVNEAHENISVSEWLSDRAHKQRRDTCGRFVARNTRTKPKCKEVCVCEDAPTRNAKPSGKTRGFKRFFVLAKALD